MYLLLAHSAVLVPPIRHLRLVGARIPPQTSLAGAVQKVEHHQGHSPEHDAHATSNNAVQIPLADGAAEAALEAEREDGHGGEEVDPRNGHEDDGGRQVGVRGPHHGDLALPQVQVPVAPVDGQRVHQHEDDGAAQHDDEEPQARPHPAEPVRPGQSLERHRRAQALRQRGELVAAVVLGLGVEGGADGARDGEGRSGGRARGGRGGEGRGDGGEGGGGQDSQRGVGDVVVVLVAMVTGVKDGPGGFGGRGDMRSVHNPGTLIPKHAAVGAEVVVGRCRRASASALRVLCFCLALCLCRRRVLVAARPQRDRRRRRDYDRGRRSRDGVRVVTLEMARSVIHLTP